jgi:uncharacterized protein (DUF924 family)
MPNEPSTPHPIPDPQTVIDFWFGAGDGPREAWFRPDPAFDGQIALRFGGWVEQALRGELDSWGLPPQAPKPPLSALALIVLLDQFTRNIHRGSAQAFAGDKRALEMAREMVARGDDRRLLPLQRWFAYLPFEHAENLQAQRESMRLFAALAAEHPALADALTWARKHHEVIERFGRYPHRNALLGRPSTPEELDFLLQPGSRF